MEPRGACHSNTLTGWSLCITHPDYPRCLQKSDVAVFHHKNTEFEWLIPTDYSKLDDKTVMKRVMCRYDYIIKQVHSPFHYTLTNTRGDRALTHTRGL